MYFYSWLVWHSGQYRCLSGSVPSSLPGCTQGLAHMVPPDTPGWHPKAAESYGQHPEADSSPSGCLFVFFHIPFTQSNIHSLPPSAGVGQDVVVLTTRPLYAQELVIHVERAQVCAVLHAQVGLQVCAVLHITLGWRTTLASSQEQLPLGTVCVLALNYQCSKKFSCEHPICLTTEMMSGIVFLEGNPVIAWMIKMV